MYENSLLWYKMLNHSQTLFLIVSGLSVLTLLIVFAVLTYFRLSFSTVNMFTNINQA